jgi:enoyl-CoA hydratase/carnithine racemase
MPPETFTTTERVRDPFYERIIGTGEVIPWADAVRLGLVEAPKAEEPPKKKPAKRVVKKPPKKVAKKAKKRGR